MTVGLLLPFDHKISVPSAGSHTGKCVITSNNEKKKQTECAVETDCFNYSLHTLLFQNSQAKNCVVKFIIEMQMPWPLDNALTLELELTFDISEQSER